MPSQCRANDGTELVGRYDRGMNEWVPLFGAAVTTVGVIGVAFWNSRGESKDIRQLRAMNEVIEGLPSDSDATRAFVDARDGLLVRVAAGIASLPRRRRLVWVVIGFAAAAVALVVIGWLATPLLSEMALNTISVVAAALVATGALAAADLLRRHAKRREEIAMKDAEELLAIFNEARRRVKFADLAQTNLKE